MNKLLTDDNYWIEIGLPLWQDASGFRGQTHCDEHKQELQEYEAKQRDDGYMTEADYQTWGRL